MCGVRDDLGLGKGGAGFFGNFFLQFQRLNSKQPSFKWMFFSETTTKRWGWGMDFRAKNGVKPLKRDFGIPKGERMEKSSSRISFQGQAVSFREDNGVMILRSGFFGWIKHLDTSDMDYK